MSSPSPLSSLPPEAVDALVEFLGKKLGHLKIKNLWLLIIGLGLLGGGVYISRQSHMEEGLVLTLLGIISSALYALKPDGATGVTVSQVAAKLAHARDLLDGSSTVEELQAKVEKLFPKMGDTVQDHLKSISKQYGLPDYFEPEPEAKPSPLKSILAQLPVVNRAPFPPPAAAPLPVAPRELPPARTRFAAPPLSLTPTTINEPVMSTTPDAPPTSSPAIPDSSPKPVIAPGEFVAVIPEPLGVGHSVAEARFGRVLFVGTTIVVLSDLSGVEFTVAPTSSFWKRA